MDVTRSPRTATSGTGEPRRRSVAAAAVRMFLGCILWFIDPGCPRAGDGLLPDEFVGGLIDQDKLSAQTADPDPLAEIGKEPNDRPGGSAAPSATSATDPHEGLWTDGCYPSAEACRKCHPGHYEEWRSSGHAYAGVSPMFHTFDAAMARYTKGTVGEFCVRCHLPVGTQIGLPRHANILDAPPVVREGVTCIVCHRIRHHAGRTHGDRRIEPGDIHAPVARSGDGRSLAATLADADTHKLLLSPEADGPGQPIHADSYFFEPLKTGEVCVSCHQVAVHPGIWLEVVHAQYRAGPAHARGIACQECHMGAVPGKPDGYTHDTIAVLNDKPHGQPRRRSYHGFWGPGYSIAHPGVFPQHPDADDFDANDWIAFDWRAGWGTNDFERSSASDAAFYPPAWSDRDDRIDARKIIDDNLAAVEAKRVAATATMEAASRIESPRLLDTPRLGRRLRVRYRVHNVSEGHNLPTGSLGAQPQLWLNVALINPAGRRVWESGYLDSNADLADLHSVDVARGRIARDRDLFNLQTKFLINNVRGTDRETALPLNFSLDQLVFLRPGAIPTSVLNHPPLIRMEAHSIPPLDHRDAVYHIPRDALRMPGTYRLTSRMRSRTEPMYFMRQIGATPEMIRRMNENMLDVHVHSHTFRVTR